MENGEFSMAMLVYQRVCLLFLVVLVVSGVSQFDFPFGQRIWMIFVVTSQQILKNMQNRHPKKIHVAYVLGPGYSV